MTDMVNMAINDMELDNVTGGATRTVKNNSLKYANIREGAGLKSKVITKLNNGTKVKTKSSTTARRSKRPATRSRRTATYGMRSRLRTDLTTRGSRAA